MDNFWVAAFWSIIPTVVVLGLFIFILRSVVHMDRNERRVYARIEAEERAKRNLPERGARDPGEGTPTLPV